MPEISVIVPVYNVEKYLDRCIKSILNSTFQDFELLLIDDGSPDNCPKLCDEWAKKDQRIKVIHQANKGLSAARNTGIENSHGRFITFIDSDDWISKDLFAVLMRIIKEYDADIAMCNMKRVKAEVEENDKEKDKITIYTKDEFLKIMLRVKGNRCVHYAWGKLYKRKVLRKDHFPVGLLNEDVEGTFKALLSSKTIVETDRVGYYYFFNNESITGKIFGENFLNLTTVWNRILDIARREAPEYLEYVDYNLKRTDFTILCDMIIYGNSETDLKYVKEKDILLQRLKKNCNYLLKSPMQIFRKLIMLLVCYNYEITKQIFRLNRLIRK